MKKTLLLFLAFLSVFTLSLYSCTDLTEEDNLQLTAAIDDYKEQYQKFLKVTYDTDNLFSGGSLCHDWTLTDCHAIITYFPGEPVEDVTLNPEVSEIKLERGGKMTIFFAGTDAQSPGVIREGRWLYRDNCLAYAPLRDGTQGLDGYVTVREVDNVTKNALVLKTCLFREDPSEVIIHEFDRTIK